MLTRHILDMEVDVHKISILETHSALAELINAFISRENWVYANTLVRLEFKLHVFIAT